MSTIYHEEHLLDRAAMIVIRRMIGAAKRSVVGSEARAEFDELMEKTPDADRVTYEAGVVGGVKGWWCRPSSADVGSAILYLHGGAYVVGSAYAYRHFVGQLAHRVKAVAFVPDYGLAPEHPFPGAVNDAHAVFRGLLAAGYARIAIAGDSAGGGLALILLSLTVKDANRGSGTRPAGAAVMSPWTDLGLTGESMTTRGEDDPLSSRAALGATAALYLCGHDPLDPLASPLYGELTGLPPVRVHVGESEVLLDDSVRYGERFEQAGGSAEVHVWHGMVHVFPSNLALLRASREALDDIASFLRRQLTVEEEPW